MAKARINLPFGDGKYDFYISPIGKILELEEKCDAGVRTIFRRLLPPGMKIADPIADTWKISDVREPIRIGLIGAGMQVIKANALIERYIDSGDWAEWAPTAREILGAHLFKQSTEPVGKPSAEGTATETATAASSPPQSTVGAQPSDSIPVPSTQ